MAVARTGISALGALALGSCASGEPAMKDTMQAAAPARGAMGSEWASTAQEPARRAKSLDEGVAIMHARMRQCWRPPVVQPGDEAPIVQVDVRLEVDGRLGAPPVVIGSPNADRVDPEVFRVARIEAERAIFECEPYDFFPAYGYDDWKRMIITFAPEP
jgi:hypothetical protein